jgi:hypothetical protein
MGIFLGNSKRVGSGLKRVATPVDGRFLVYKIFLGIYRLYHDIIYQKKIFSMHLK